MLGVAVMGIALLTATSCATARDETTPKSTPTVEGNIYMYESSNAIAGCLRDKGWEVEVTSSGGWGIEAEFPADQESAYTAAYEECAKETGYDKIEMTPDLASFNYDNTVRVVECLEEAGFSTPDGPTRQAYVDKVLEDPAAVPWDPYEYVPADDLTDAILACPQ